METPPRGSSGRSPELDDEDEWQTFYDAARTMRYARKIAGLG